MAATWTYMQACTVWREILFIAGLLSQRPYGTTVPPKLSCPPHRPTRGILQQPLQDQQVSAGEEELGEGEDAADFDEF